MLPLPSFLVRPHSETSLVFVTHQQTIETTFLLLKVNLIKPTPCEEVRTINTIGREAEPFWFKVC